MTAKQTKRMREGVGSGGRGREREGGRGGEENVVLFLHGKRKLCKVSIEPLATLASTLKQS